MKKLSVLMAVFFLAASLQAQQEVVWGPKQKEGRWISILSVPGILDGNFYVYKGKSAVLGSDKTMMQMYNYDMEPVGEEKMDLVYSGKELDPEFSLQFGGKIYMFSSFCNTKTDLKYLFVDEIDPKTLKLKNQVKKIGEIPYRNRFNAGDFTPVFSRDSTHLLIVGNVNSKNKEPEKYNLYVFTEGMEPEWEKEVTLDIKEKFFMVEDFVIDNAGDAYLTGTAFSEQRANKRDGSPNYVYQVMAYRNKGTETEEYTLRLSSRFITDLLLQISPAGDLLCAGFYSDVGQYGIKGSFYMVIDKDSRDVVSESTKEFEMDFLTMNFTEKQERKAEKRKAKGKGLALYSYRLDRIIPRGDGGAVLSAEQFYTYTYTTYTRGANGTGGQWVTHIVYVYNDIVVVSISPDGDIEWATKIPKRQRSVDDGGFYSSYALMITGGELHFIFNDSDRNIEIEKQGDIANFDVRDKRGLVMIASVDSEGNIDRRPLFTNREVETITRPKLCRQISPDEMLLFGQRGRANQFGRITFAD